MTRSRKTVAGRRRFYLQLLLLCLFCFSPAVFSSAPITTSSTSSSVSKKTLQAKIKEVEASTSLDEETRTKLVELYRKTLSFQETAHANSEAAQAFLQARKLAASQAKKIRAELEKSRKTEVRLSVSQRSPIDDIEQQLLREKSNLTAIDAKLADIQQQLVHENERNTTAGEQLAAAKAKQEEIAAQLAAPAPATEGEPASFAEARHWLLQGQVEALRSEIRMLDEELLSQPMRIDLLEAQRDQAQRSLERAQTRVRLLTDLLNEKQRTQTERAVEKAEEAMTAAEGKHPLVKALAEKNAALGNELNRLVTELERVTAGSDVAASEAKRIDKEFRSARKKLEYAGISQAIGQVLLEQRRALPNVSLFEAEISRRESLIADAGLRQIQLEEERKALRDVDGYINSLATGLSAAELKPLRRDLEKLIESRRVLVNKALSLNKSYLRALGEFDTTRRELIKVVNRYDAYLAERLLWIRSSPPISLEMMRSIPAQIGVLLSPTNWQGAGRVLFSRLTESPLFVLSLLAVLALLAKTRSLHAMMAGIAEQANDPLKGDIVDSLKALGLTLLIAANWPALLALLAWQLDVSLASTQFTSALAAALLKLATAWFFLRTFHVLMAANGVADAHFNWPRPLLDRLRPGLFRFMTLFLPLIFIAVFISSYDAQALGKGLARLTLVLALLLIAIATYRLFGARDNIFVELLNRATRKRSLRLRIIWLFIGLLVPVLLMVIALMGYMYTAGTLTGRLLYTLWLALGLFVVQQLAVRWLTLTQRRIRYQALLEEHDKALAAKDEDDSDGAALPPLEEPKVDLASLDQESRKLLNTAMVILSLTGLWLIWSEVLPAFGIFDEMTLWHTMGMEGGEEKLVAITFADLGIALLIAVMTVVAVRSVPALIELVLLQRLSLQAGSSYAATTLTRYGIASVGTLSALGAVGASWSQVQWLVAALSVGIGFGLQEIVANFISGLIILFERPIRVGDVVTVGESTGTVTRIQIRATTILTYDRQELLVPNKEFITGRLLNWSLSDQVTRVVVSVGVAYGSDVDKAMAIIEAAATDNERVLENPAPFVTFESFDDSSLLLNLRCFLGSVDYRLAVISELHSRINKDLAAADIAIAFPQRDLHLDTSSPLDVRIQPATASSSPS